MYEQRDIVLMPFPYTDLTGAKKRPALIISNNVLNEDCICCLITSQQTEQGLPLKKEQFEKGTLPFKSWIKPHRIFTINKGIIDKKLCKVTHALHHEIVKKIKTYVGEEKR
tara:strand:+ start:63 stop:395 length:333 start_codon:yes stop_codon:yes gene_type:complete